MLLFKDTNNYFKVLIINFIITLLRRYFFDIKIINRKIFMLFFSNENHRYNVIKRINF